MLSISCRNVFAGYADVAVVRDLSLSVDPGEVVLLLGPNGAGKTTTLLTIAGLLPPLGGEIEVLGAPVDVARPHVMADRGFSFVPDNRALVTGLSVRDNLRVARKKNGMSLDDIFALLPSLAVRVNVKAGALSGGEQQQLAMARALMSRPRALVVDEMSMGLAPIIVQQLLEILVRTARESNIGMLLVEQHVSLALEVADRAYVMVHGDMMLSRSTHELRANPSLLAEAYLGKSTSETHGNLFGPDPDAQSP